jgi:hypothetical protein
MEHAEEPGGEDFGLPDNIVTHLIAREGEALPPYGAIKCEYIMTASGLMVRSKRDGLEVCIPVAVTAAPLPGLAEVAAYAQFEHEPVPEAFLAEMIERARRACRGSRAAEFLESLFHLTYEPSAGGWVLHEPDQLRRHGAVRPSDDGPDSSYASALVEIHVHPDTDPDFSDQDDYEESGKFRVFGIIYNLWGDRPRLRIRLGVHDHFCQIPAAWLFELPEHVTDVVAEEIEAAAAAEAFAPAEEGLSDGALR